MSSVNRLSMILSDWGIELEAVGKSLKLMQIAGTNVLRRVGPHGLHSESYSSHAMTFTRFSLACDLHFSVPQEPRDPS